MKDLKILYYSNAFIANHGGRLHSEAFLKEAARNKNVLLIEAYPKPAKKQKATVSKEAYIKEYFKKNKFLQVLFFYRRNLKSLQTITSKLNKSKNNFNVIHIRVDSNFLIIPKLKKRFPHLMITTEVNASPFDENFGNISFINHFKKLEKKALEKANANFFVSGFLKEKIMNPGTPERDYVVHNGVDLDLFQPKNKSDFENEKVIFGYIGTIDYHKNLKNLIDAFSIVSKKVKTEIKLLIIGDGPMFKELMDYVKLNNLEHSVELKGWIDHVNIVDYLGEMDIAIHHSANPYMSPLKLFEYMAVGLPVIGPNIPAVKEIFTPGEDIILVENDKNELAEKMLYLLRDKVYREKIALSGKEKIRSLYGWDSNASKITEVMVNKFEENTGY